MKKEANNNKTSIKALLYSLISAICISFLIIFSVWGFELRSAVKLISQGGLLAIPLVLLFYFILFRKNIKPLQMDVWTVLIGISAAILTASWLVPPQITPSRTIAAVGITTFLFFVVFTLLIYFTQENRGGSWSDLTIWVVLVLGVAGTALVFYNSSFARLYSDDLCYAVNFDELGFPGAAFFFYRDWSGRFFSNFLVMGFTDQAHSILYLIIFTTISIFALTYFLLKDQNIGKRAWSAAAVALFFMATISIAAPDFYKSFFWICSTMIMFPIFILVPLYLIGLYRMIELDVKKPALLIALGAVLSFCITTTHEVGGVSFLALNGLSLVWALLTRKRGKQLYGYLIAAILASLIGFAIMLSAPGIDNRAQIQQYPGSTPILQTVPIVIRNFLDFISNIHNPYYTFEGDRRPGWLLLIGVLGLGWLLDSPLKRDWRSALIVAAMTAGIILASSFPAAYVFRGNIPIRTQMIPTYFMTLGALLVGALVPKPDKRSIKVGVNILVFTSILLGMGVALPRLVEISGPLKQYADDWDTRDAYFTQIPGTPERIEVPWDEYEQNINCVELYYTHIYRLNKSGE